MTFGGTLDYFIQGVFNFPALSDAYKYAAYDGLQALARRRALTLTPTIVRVADLEVDLGTRHVRRAGQSIDLTAKEFALLELLLRHRDQVVDRSAITAHVWDHNHDPFANVLEVLVRRLRSKIDDGFEPKLIRTVRGAGYRLGASG